MQVGKINMPTLQNGDKLLFQDEKAGKLDSEWVGPYKFYEIYPNCSNVILELSKKKKKNKNKKKKKMMKVHMNRLKAKAANRPTILYGKIKIRKKEKTCR